MNGGDLQIAVIRLREDNRKLVIALGSSGKVIVELERKNGKLHEEIRTLQAQLARAELKNQELFVALKHRDP